MAATSSDIPPSQTLYIGNLNEKIKKGELKKRLYAAFIPFGPIMDVVACRTAKLRGQAWVVFEDVGAATAAMCQMQGFIFFDKPMRITFAKSKSDAVAKKEGTVLPPRKRRREEDDGSAAEAERPAKRSNAPGAGAAAVAIGAAAAPVLAAAPVAALPSGYAVPNKLLLVQGIPLDMAEDALRALFAAYAGFKELRLVRDRGLGFAEYESEGQAAPAMQGLHNFKVAGGAAITVTYAKK